MSESFRFTIVIPAKDEAESLPEVVREITTTLAGQDYEIVVVDDGSGDGTAPIMRDLMLREPRLRCVSHQRSRGKSAAILTGVRAARAPLIVTFDGDGQNDPGHIPALLALVGEPGVGLAAGQRVRHAHSAGKRFSSWVANRLRSRLLKDETRDSACGLKAFSRESFLRLPPFDGMHRFLPALVLREGLQVRHLEVTDRPRRHGKSKYGLLDRGLSGAVDLWGSWWLIRRHLDAPTVAPSKDTRATKDSLG